MKRFSKTLFAVAVLAAPVSASAQDAPPPTSSPAASPELLYACYIPTSGTVYRIRLSGLSQECLAAGHQMFTWHKDGVQGPAGPQGPAGADGVAGSAGAEGPQGPAGPSAFDFWQSLPGNSSKTIEEFYASLTGPQGPAGAQGPQGPQGQAGLSAFEYWQSLPGNTGRTVEEFYASLTGPQGPAGAPGLQGPEGQAGQSAFEIWQTLPGNAGRTIEEFFTSLTGAQGAAGLNAFQVWQTVPGNENKTIEEFYASLVGAQGPNGDVGPQGPQGVPGIQVATEPFFDQAAKNQSMESKETLAVVVSCPAGQLLLGGGGRALANDNADQTKVALFQSYPSSATTWTVVGQASSTLGQGMTVMAYAICTK